MRNHWMSMVLASALTLGSAATWAQTASEQLEKAIYQEKTAGDLDAAIKIYQGIIDQEKAGRPAMAQAYYRIGLCLAKKGEKDNAIEAFQAVVKNYSDQKTLASAAQKELEKLGVTSGKPFEVVRRAINKKVADFPKEIDLSTPESAVAAYHRASARMDEKAVADLSWNRIDPEELDRVWKRGNPEDLKVYNQAQLDAEVVEVLNYGPDLADVITLLKFPPGVGRGPYSERLFGRIDGQWKNLGEDRLPSAEAARQSFEAKKDTLRDYFERIKKARGPSAVKPRTVNKKVADFPKEVDLSTPESACAAFNRASAAMDDKATTDLSWWLQADREKAEKEMQRAKAADPEDLKIYLQGLLEGTIVEVLQDGDDLAQVTNFLNFPEGKGRHPYSARIFGRIDGKWKNLCEDRLPSVEAARDSFNAGKDALREHFEQIKKDPGATTRPASLPRDNRQLLDKETREALDRFDQIFKGYFAPETAYESASRETRADTLKNWMEDAKSQDFDRRTRAIAALGNIRAKEAVPVLMDIINEKMGNQRPKWMAVRALGRIGDPVAVPAFIELVDHGNKNVQAYARAALADITGVYFEGDKDAWRKWWTQQGEKLSPPNQPSNKAPAAEGPGPHRNLLDPETRQAVQNFDRSFESQFRPETAYEIASQEKRADMVKSWMEDAKSQDFDRRTRAIAALGNIRAKQAVPVLMDIVNEKMGNQRPKWMAVRALGRIGDPVAVPAFIELVDHGNKNVQVYARAALADITGVYFGGNKEEWRQWWKDHGEKIPQANQQQSKAGSRR